MNGIGGSPFLGPTNFGGISEVAHSADDLQDLLKSLTAGHDAAGGGADPSGFALRPESLEASLAVQTYKDKHVKFWKKISKKPAYSTVEEYNRLVSYGSESLSAFMGESALPVADDASYLRKNVLIKYMGTLRAVSHQMGLVRNVDGDRVAAETRNGTMWLMRQIEKALFFGSSSLVDTQFDGIRKLLEDAITAGEADAGNIIDKRTSGDAGLGGELAQDDLDEVAELIHTGPNYGEISDIYYGTGVHRRLGQNLLGSSQNRLNVDNHQGGPIKPGFSFSAVSTLFGDVNVEPDVFLQPDAYTEAQLTDAAFAKTSSEGTAPGVVSLGLAEAGTDASFGSQTGVYKYIVVAVNQYGNSVGNAAASQTLTGGTKHIAVTITKGTGTPSGYVVYRTLPGGATYYEVARIAYTGSPQVWNDINANIAGTGVAFALEFTEEVICWKQLAPFTRIPLAQINLSSRWVQVLYGAPELRIPRRVVMWKNLLI